MNMNSNHSISEDNLSEEKTEAFCKICGEELPPDHTGPCPECGNTGKVIDVHLKESVSVTGSMKTALTQEYIKENPSIIILNVIITIISSLVSLFFVGFLGVLIGPALGLASLLLAPYTRTKVKKKKVF